MTLSAAGLRDKALELAKRLNHASVEVPHVLSVALSELPEEAKLAFQPEIKTQLLSQARKVGQASIAFSSSGDSAVKKLVSNQYKSEIFSELLEANPSLEVDREEQIAPTVGGKSAKAKLKSDEIVEKTSISDIGSTRGLEEVLRDLDSLVGLGEVKKQVRSVMATHLVNKKRVESGLNPVSNSLHLVFSGEPGTGKTTVARLVSEIYKAQGILRTGHLVEVGRSDLIAEYVGQTAPKVQKAIEQALGGVLFIDEAYSLAQDTQNGFGGEAISTLLQLMENHRGDLSVIVAGYKDEMEFLVGSNPGLRSRFQTYIEFPKYQEVELVQIFRRLCVVNQIELTADVETEVLKHFQVNETSGTSGNARYARKLFEVAFTQLSGRAVEDGIIEDHEISAFVPSDIPQSLMQSTKLKNRIGFGGQ